MSVRGASSIMSLACVNVGAPASAARPATCRYSPGLAAGAYPMSTPMPSAPSARSPDSRPSMAVTSAGVASRCHSLAAMLPSSVPSRPSGVRPATASIRACAQDAAKP